MTRKVSVMIPVVVIMSVDDDVDIGEAVSEMLWSFETEDNRITIEDTQWGEYDIIDSK
jgi:hypothetical protein